MSKRLFKVLPLLCIVAFAAFETFMFFDALKQKQHSDFIATVTNLESELDTIMTAINGGNQNLYDKSYQDFVATSTQLANNSQGQELAMLAEDYSKLLVDQRESISDVIAVRAATINLNQQLSQLPNQITPETLEAYLMQLQYTYTEYSRQLQDLDLYQNQEFIKQLATISQNFANISQNISECIDVCYKSSYEALAQKLQVVNQSLPQPAMPNLDDSKLREKINSIKE